MKHVDNLASAGNGSTKIWADHGPWFGKKKRLPSGLNANSSTAAGKMLVKDAKRVSTGKSLTKITKLDVKLGKTNVYEDEQGPKKPVFSGVGSFKESSKFLRTYDADKGIPGKQRVYEFETTRPILVFVVGLGDHNLVEDARSFPSGATKFLDYKKGLGWFWIIHGGVFSRHGGGWWARRWPGARISGLGGEDDGRALGGCAGRARGCRRRWRASSVPCCSVFGDSFLAVRSCGVMLFVFFCCLFVCCVVLSVRFSEFLNLRLARVGAPCSTWKKKVCLVAMVLVEGC